ncbi:hypothetical protein Hanom_Chr13g01208701 [Helianthus anomalus]
MHHPINFYLKVPINSFVDVAIKIVHDRPELTVSKELLTHVLLALAPKTHAFKRIKPHIVFRIIKSSKYMPPFFFSFFWIYSIFENRDEHVLLRIGCHHYAYDLS